MSETIVKPWSECTVEEKTYNVWENVRVHGRTSEETGKVLGTTSAVIRSFVNRYNIRTIPRPAKPVTT